MFNKIIRYDRFRNKEHVPFNEDMIGLLADADQEGMNINGIYPKYTSAINSLKGAIEYKKKSEYTTSINYNNVVRNGIFRSIVLKVNMYCTTGNDPVMKAHADRIYICMHHYRKSQTKVLTERNATFRKFIQDMRAEYAEQVTALSLTAQLTQLETCCTTIERNMNQRQFAKGKRYEAISVKEARTEVQKHFDSMVQVMNTALLLNCTDELLALKEKFNGVVLFYKTAISVRIKAKKNVSNSQAVVSEGAEAMM